MHIFYIAAQGYPRATGDFDIWIEANAENPKRVYRKIERQSGCSFSQEYSKPLKSKKYIWVRGFWILILMQKDILFANLKVHAYCLQRRYAKIYWPMVIRLLRRRVNS